MSNASSINTAMLFAAGLGTRLKPFTNHHPKALAVVNGKTLLARNIEYLKQQGITNIVVNVHHFAQQIIDALAAQNNFGINIQVSNETSSVLETGGGLLYASPLLSHTPNIVVMNVDILTNMSLQPIINAHYASNALATLAVSDRNSSRKLLFNSSGQLNAWLNTQTNETKPLLPQPYHQLGLQAYAFSGIHIINTHIFKHITHTGKFSIIDVYLQLMQQHQIIGYNHTGQAVIDVGKPESILEAEKYFL